MKIINHEDMYNLLKKGLFTKLNQKFAVGLYAENRQQFEGWLQVEIIEILSKHFTKILPEKDNVDITIGDEWAIELKVVSLNRKDKLCKKTGNKNITDKKLSIIKDIDSLRSDKISKTYKNKAVVIIVSPFHKDDNDDWMKHQSSKKMEEGKYIQIKDYIPSFNNDFFNFENNIGGMLYYGKVH